MNSNALYVIVVILAVAAGIMGYRLYQEHERDKGAHIEIDVGKSGMSIQKN